MESRQAINCADEISGINTRTNISSFLNIFVYFYIIIRDEDDKLFGKYLTTLETSLPNMKITYDNETNTIYFSIADKVINSVSLSNMKLDCGSWD